MSEESKLNEAIAPLLVGVSETLEALVSYLLLDQLDLDLLSFLRLGPEEPLL